MAELIDGRSMARVLSEHTAHQVRAPKARGVQPAAAVLVGNDPASEVHVGRGIAERRNVKAAEFAIHG